MNKSEKYDKAFARILDFVETLNSHWDEKNAQLQNAVLLLKSLSASEVLRKTVVNEFYGGICDTYDYPNETVTYREVILRRDPGPIISPQSKFKLFKMIDVRGIYTDVMSDPEILSVIFDWLESIIVDVDACKGIETPKRSKKAESEVEPEIAKPEVVEPEVTKPEVAEPAVKSPLPVQHLHNMPPVHDPVYSYPPTSVSLVPDDFKPEMLELFNQNEFLGVIKRDLRKYDIQMGEGAISNIIKAPEMQQMVQDFFENSSIDELFSGVGCTEIEALFVVMKSYWQNCPVIQSYLQKFKEEKNSKFFTEFLNQLSEKYDGEKTYRDAIKEENIAPFADPECKIKCFQDINLHRKLMLLENKEDFLAQFFKQMAMVEMMSLMLKSPEKMKAKMSSIVQNLGKVVDNEEKLAEMLNPFKITESLSECVSTEEELNDLMQLLTNVANLPNARIFDSATMSSMMSGKMFTKF